MSPTPAQVLAAVKASGVAYTLADGWDNPAIAAHQGAWEPSYVILHHTANGGAKGNAPSLNWVINDPYKPIRACHFLVGRDGHVYMVYALACYHAGLGGPGSWGAGPRVDSGDMNRHAYGIEIESKGTSLDPNADNGTNGLTTAQLTATAKLTRALLDMLGKPAENAINHRTWAPGRKSDTLLDDVAWHRRIKAATAVGGGGAGVPVPPTRPQVAWTRDLMFHSSGADVNELLSTFPRGQAQLRAARRKGVAPVIDYASWAWIRLTQVRHPKQLSDELKRGVVGPKTWAMFTHHA